MTNASRHQKSRRPDRRPTPGRTKGGLGLPSKTRRSPPKTGRIVSYPSPKFVGKNYISDGSHVARGQSMKGISSQELGDKISQFRKELANTYERIQTLEDEIRNDSILFSVSDDPFQGSGYTFEPVFISDPLEN